MVVLICVAWVAQQQALYVYLYIFSDLNSPFHIPFVYCIVYFCTPKYTPGVEQELYSLPVMMARMEASLVRRPDPIVMEAQVCWVIWLIVAP